MSVDVDQTDGLHVHVLSLIDDDGVNIRAGCRRIIDLRRDA